MVLFFAGVMLGFSCSVMFFRHILDKTFKKQQNLFIHLWYRILACLLSRHAVMLMDYDNKIKYTLAREQDGKLLAPAFWTTVTGQIVMLPNGLVCKDCPCSYYYVWRYLDQNLEAAKVLAYTGDMPSWQEWEKMNHSEKMDLREKIIKEM